MIRTMSRVAILAAMIGLPACSDPSEAQTPVAEAAAEGRPYQLAGSQVWSVPDPGTGRDYEVFVSLPASYEEQPARTYPVLYVTDADYAFPVIRSIARRVGDGGAGLEDFILVGLSYAGGDSPTESRNRDYTPTPQGPRRSRDMVHGQARAYQAYVRDEVLPFVEARFRADPARRIYMGHSYGGLLGAQILFTEPSMFRDYILGSPSFWYDGRHMLEVEAGYAAAHADLPANVFMYIGAFETVREGDHRYNQTNDMVRDMAEFERRLRSRNYPGLTLASDVVSDEDHLTVFPSGLTRGLIHILPPDQQAGGTTP